MKNMLKGLIIGAVSGMLAGGILTAKNKNISNKINTAIDKTKNKFTQLKNKLSKKDQCDCGADDCACNTTNNK